MRAFATARQTPPSRPGLAGRRGCDDDDRRVDIVAMRWIVRILERSPPELDPHAGILHQRRPTYEMRTRHETVNEASLGDTFRTTKRGTTRASRPGGPSPNAG
jgi:hypothetical protein